jgi:hypothetical protein
LSGSNSDEDSWNVDFAVEYGMRPGEREIIPGNFSSMYVSIVLVVVVS